MVSSGALIGTCRIPIRERGSLGRAQESRQIREHGSTGENNTLKTHFRIRQEGWLLTATALDMTSRNLPRAENEINITIVIKDLEIVKEGQYCTCRLSAVSAKEDGLRRGPG